MLSEGKKLLRASTLVPGQMPGRSDRTQFTKWGKSPGQPDPGRQDGQRECLPSGNASSDSENALDSFFCEPGVSDSRRA